jgi:hypothetical protein
MTQSGAVHVINIKTKLWETGKNAEEQDDGCA